MAFALTGFNIFLTTFGGWVTLFGLFSLLLKEKYFLSEPCQLQSIAVWRTMPGLDKTQKSLTSFIQHFLSSWGLF